MEWQKDGTMTYYDLWPESQVGSTELQTDVTADYNKRTISSLSDLTNTDVSISGETGKVSEFGEGRAADGIVQIPTTRTQDNQVSSTLDAAISSNGDYNACTNNCSNFAENGLKAAYPNTDASQMVWPPFPLNMMYNDTRVTAPNNLYNEAAQTNGAIVIKGPNRAQARPYLEYFGKSNRRP